MIVAMNRLAAVVFDFDGIILDSETPEFEAHRVLFERCGRSLTRDEWCDQIGIWSEGQADRWFEALRGAPGAPETFDDFVRERRRLFLERVSGAPMRGIGALLDALHGARVPLGVATSSPAQWVTPWLDRLGIRDRFGAVVTGNDVTSRKPAPDIYLEIARRLGAAPSRAVAIEDSGPGIAAARAAGLKTVAIPHWLTETHDLSAADLRVAHAGEITVERLAALVD
jgi:HAD superfamily hydrolase (TIGR01509 family)